MQPCGDDRAQGKRRLEAAGAWRASLGPQFKVLVSMTDYTQQLKTSQNDFPTCTTGF